jgi:hypothetical protein
MRTIGIVLNDLINSKLKEEESLERLINSTDSNFTETVNKIKITLREISILNEMITTWRSYSTTPESDNNIGPNMDPKNNN